MNDEDFTDVICIEATYKGHRYLFRFVDTKTNRDTISSVMNRWASDPRLNLKKSQVDYMLKSLTEEF